MGWRRAPRPFPIQWWRSPLPRADRPLKAQPLQRPSPPNNARSSSSGSQRGKPLKWSKRMKKKTMRQLKMASSPKERGWRLLHHLLHLLLQHQHHLPRQLHLQHCFHRQSKQFPWRRRFLWLRLPSPTSWRTPPSASTPYVSAGGGPPSTASTAEAAPGGDEGAHNSPIIITQSPSSPPRQEAPTQQPTQEGGGENQQQAPPVPPRANLSLEVKRVW